MVLLLCNTAANFPVLLAANQLVSKQEWEQIWD